MNSKTDYDIAFLGNYTKDTIVSSSGKRIVDGGAFNYGSHVAARMGLRTAAITRLVMEDFHVVREIEQLGVKVFAHPAPASTCLRLEYPTPDVDNRIIFVLSDAGPFSPAEVRDVQAQAFVVGASFRGEVSLEVIAELDGKDALLAVDVQGFLRVVRDGKMVPEPWPEKQGVLSRINVLKSDAVEAELLTGATDIRQAALMIADLGPREVMITHRQGVLVYASGEFHEAGFFPGKLIGRSGRGDTCIAAYVSRRLTPPPAEATVWAAAVASLKMEAEGPFRRDIRAVEMLIERKY
jgi:sugar/nucleoside kinase (ribokinase family)